MSEVTVRRATPADYRAIDDLMRETRRLVLRIPWDQVICALARHDFFLVEKGGQMGCVCGLYVEPDTVAQVRVFALHDAWSMHETLQSLLPPVVTALREQEVTTLAFIGSEEWLLDGLISNNFRQTNAIVTLQKTNLAVPDPGNLAVVVRPANRDDFAAILCIDEATLEPLWHNTTDTLSQYSDSGYFAVAELNDQVAGYTYATLTGRHGHLARIAVHPDWQGRRIGVRLLAEVMHFFQRKCVFGFTLNTQQDNARARRLYEWFGFKLLGKEAEVLIRDV